MIKIEKTDEYESIWIEKEAYDLKRKRRYSVRIFGVKIYQRNYDFKCDPLRSDVRNDIINNKKIGF